MTDITGKTTESTGMTSYRYWVSPKPTPADDPKAPVTTINLTDRSADLKPGPYWLFWECSGNAGAKLEFNISAAAGVLTKVTKTLTSSGSVKPTSRTLTVP